MRHPFAMTGLMAGLLMAAGATAAHDYNFSTDSCNHSYGTAYDLDVTSSGLAFHRDTGSPEKVFLHDGRLKVDGHDVATTAADAEALRRYEAGVRALMPQVAALAREATDMGFTAMTTVTMTFAEGEQRAAILEKLKRKQARSLREIDEGIGSGHWSGDRMTETVTGAVSDSVGELVGSVTSAAVEAALSGDSGKVAALGARADALDKAIDKEMDRRSKNLDARVRDICPRLNALADIQQGWAVRTPDGQPLQLMTIKPKDEQGHGKVVAKF